MANQIQSDNLTPADKETMSRLMPVLISSIQAKIDGMVEKSVSKILNIPLSVEVASAILGENPKTVYKWQQRGRIHFTKKSGRLSITLQELTRQLSEDELTSRLQAIRAFYNQSNLETNGKC